MKLTVAALSSCGEPAAPRVARDVMALPVPARPAVSKPCSRGRWLLTASAAVVVHLTVLAAIMIAPPAPVADDEASPPLVVTLVMEPEATPATVTPPVQALPTPEPPPPPAEPPVPDNPPPPVPQPEPEPIPLPKPAETLPLPPPPEQPPRVVHPPVTRPAPAPARPPVAAPAAPPRTSSQAVTSDLLGAYRNSLAAHLRAYQRYPALARARREQGLVVVRVTITRDGRIVAASVEHGSGWEALDREALATLKRADPLPAMPEGVPGTTMELLFPLRFTLE